jgi:hypothetical protein
MSSWNFAPGVSGNKLQQPCRLSIRLVAAKFSRSRAVIFFLSRKRDDVPKVAATPLLHAGFVRAAYPA